MTGQRRAYLDRSPGEERAVVTLDGRPERLLIQWEDDPLPRIGARYAARVEGVSARMGLARLDLGEAFGVLKLKGVAPPVGRRLWVEVVAEPYADKPAAVRWLRDAAGEAPAPGLVAPAPDLMAHLVALGFPDPGRRDEARELADEAEALALASFHRLPGGVELALEQTRALTAVDVDLEEGGLSPSRANLLAVQEAARLLRLKSIGGLVAIDLVGFPKDPQAVMAAATDAFSPDRPGVSIAPVSRFGVLELAKPHARQPIAERLKGPDGRPGARALAQATVRALQREARSRPGERLVARRAPAVAALAQPLAARLGPLFSVEADPGAAWDGADILTR